LENLPLSRLRGTTYSVTQPHVIATSFIFGTLFPKTAGSKNLHQNIRTSPKL
jgi:hypothetical protein